MIIPNIGGGAWGQLLNISINTMKLVGWLTNRRLALVNRGPKRQFSELTGEAVCNQEYASGLEQRLNDEAEPVVAQSQALVFQDPGIAAFYRPAPLAQSRPARLTALVDARLGPKGAAQLAMMFRVVAFVGEYRANAGHDREGGQEQPLEDKRVINIGRR